MAVAPPIRSVGRLAGRVHVPGLVAALALTGAAMLAVLAPACFSAAIAATAEGQLKRVGWELAYEPTSGSVTDGTAFYNARFRGMPVFADMRVPFAYIDYTDGIPPFRDIVDQLGTISWDRQTPTFRGCKGKRITREDRVPGYVIDCDYTFDVPAYPWMETPPDEKAPRCALYRYNQRLYLYADGSFRPEVITWGPGYDNPHNYIIGIRIDFAVGKNGNALDAAFARMPGRWAKVGREGYRRGGRVDRGGFAWFIAGGANGRPPGAWIRPGGDTGVLFVFSANAQPDSIDGLKQSTTPAEFAAPAQPLSGRRDIYTWYRGTLHNPGCYTIPLAIGPGLITLQGY